MDDGEAMTSIDSRVNECSEAALPISSVLSFSALREAYGVDWPPAGEMVRVRADSVTALLKMITDQISADEQLYPDKYPDVNPDIMESQFRSAKHHHVEFGYFGNRQPHHIEADDNYYRSRNPDITQRLRIGEIPSSQLYFERHGFREGRFLRNGWPLITSPGRDI